MSDRFKFRAKRCDNGEFVFGYLNFIYVDKPEKARIYCQDDTRSYDVITKTLGQCTGLKDENGKLIYGGDIVECFYDHFDGNFTEKKVIGVVKWGIGEWSVQNERKGDWYFLSYANYDEKHLQSDSVKVIGNIHENPEMLEEK